MSSVLESISFLIGVSGCLAIAILNSYNIFVVFVRKEPSVYHPDLLLFYYRFLVDLYFAFTTFVYLIFLNILSISDAADFHWLLIYLSLSCYNSVIAQGWVSLFIASKRLFAIQFPIKYRNSNQILSSRILFFGALFYALLEDFLAIYPCGNSFAYKPGCRTLGCLTNSCFQDLGYYARMLMSILSIIVSVTFFILLTRTKRYLESSTFIFINVLITRDILIVLFLKSIPAVLVSSHMKQLFPILNSLGQFLPTIATIATLLEIISFTWYTYQRTRNNQTVSNQLPRIRTT